MSEIIVTIDEHTSGAITEAEAIALQEAEALAEAQAKAVQDAKDAKDLALNTITVTTSALNVFDGNETARTDMLSAILTSDFMAATENANFASIANPTQAEIDAHALAIMNATHHDWKLADNTVKLISINELKEALALAIQAKGQIVLGGTI